MNSHKIAAFYSFFAEEKCAPLKSLFKELVSYLRLAAGSRGIRAIEPI